MVRLASKTAFIAGATSGIGKVTAERFAAEGAQVVVAGRRSVEGEEIANAICASGGDAIYIKADVTDDASIAAAIESSVAHYGKLDILFSNAGGSTAADGPVISARLEEFWRVVKLDMYGTFLVNRYGIPELLKAGGGAVINMASLAGVTGSMGRHSYATAKGGVVAMTLSLAKEYAACGVRVNALAPAAVATSRIAGLMENPAVRQHVETSQVLGLIEPSEIAAAAAFFASDDARCITGQILSIHAGAFG